MKLFPSMSLSKNQPGQMKVFFGLGLVVLAFLGLGVIVYIMNQVTAKQQDKIQELHDRVSQLSDEKSITQMELDHLKVEGDSIKLNKLVAAAENVYDEKERARREGILWIDRKNKTYVVTLGAIHGLKSGSTLNVYDADKKIGMLRIETPYDVISFTAPVKPLNDTSDKNYFRVLIE